MTNQERRRLLDQVRASGMEGSILDVFQAAEQGRDIIAEHKQSKKGNKPLVAETPKNRRKGSVLTISRGNGSMIFKDVPPNTPFNTMGMKRPIDIKKVPRAGTS